MELDMRHLMAVKVSDMRKSSMPQWIALQRKLIRKLHRDKLIWMWLAILTNLTWLVVWVTR